jgi:hypothetical protein
MFVGGRSMLVSVAAMFVSRVGVFFGFGMTTVVVMMSRMTVMVRGKFVMHRRDVMMLARMMFGFRHENLLGYSVWYFVDPAPRTANELSPRSTLGSQRSGVERWAKLRFHDTKNCGFRLIHNAYREPERKYRRGWNHPSSFTLTRTTSGGDQCVLCCFCLSVSRYQSSLFCGCCSVTLKRIP